MQRLCGNTVFFYKFKYGKQKDLQEQFKEYLDDIELMKKLAEIGKLNKENIKLIAQMSGISFTAAEEMLNALAEEAIQSMEPGFRYLARQGLVDEAVEVAKSKNVKQGMGNLQKQAKHHPAGNRPGCPKTQNHKSQRSKTPSPLHPERS